MQLLCGTSRAKRRPHFLPASQTLAMASMKLTIVLNTSTEKSTPSPFLVHFEHNHQSPSSTQKCDFCVGRHEQKSRLHVPLPHKHYQWLQHKVPFCTILRRKNRPQAPLWLTLNTLTHLLHQHKNATSVWDFTSKMEATLDPCFTNIINGFNKTYHSN